MYFVQPSSIVRTIWGNSDTILFIFAGSAAEFSLNKAVDWLYFTGRLPNDPLERLFSTVAYSRKIVFSSLEEANAAIDQITKIHKGVELSRNAQIPMWAYRDVLYMLIDYSIRSYELLERKLSEAEKEEVFNVLIKIGIRMKIEDLPTDYLSWLISREKHLKEDLIKSDFTVDLFNKYKIHLGAFRYFILIKSQVQIVPSIVKEYLGLKPSFVIHFLLQLYKLGRKNWIMQTIKNWFLPAKYRKQISELNNPYL